MSIRDFIEYNRQTGTTTALVGLVISSGGYLVVGSMNQVNRVIYEYPQLKGKVFSVERGLRDYRGVPKDKIFFDTTAVLEISKYNWKIVNCIEERNIEAVWDDSHDKIIDLKPDNDSYKGRLVLQRDDGRVLEFKLSL